MLRYIIMSQPENPYIQQLEATSSVLLLPANYETALSGVIREGELALSGLHRWGTDFETSGLSLEEFLKQRAELIGDTFSDRGGKIKHIIGVVPELLQDLPDLSDRDREVFWDVSSIDSLGLGIQHLRNGSSTAAKRAMHSGLDRRVLQEAVRHRSIDDVIAGTGYASSPTARLGMRTIIDEPLFRRVKSSATPSIANQEISHASTASAQQAMRTEFDRKTFGLARQTSRSGLESASGALHELSGVSSDASRSVMEREIDRELRSRHQQRGSSRTNSGTRNNANSGSGSSRQSPPRQETTGSDDPYESLLTKLRRTADISVVRTIEAEDRNAVTKVLNTVKALREQNPGITDREIAIKYYTRSNNNHGADPSARQATQILMVLMGGKISGRLPV
jgi:hypothetical protein